MIPRGELSPLKPYCISCLPGSILAVISISENMKARPSSQEVQMKKVKPKQNQ